MKSSLLKKFIFLVLFSLVLIPLCPSGNSENQEQDNLLYTIEDARVFIDNQQYNEAMEILVQIVRNDPEQMERAQTLIIEIRKYRDLYNLKYEELMTVLFEEEDYEKSLALIQELESLDPNPNNATQDSIRDARISAELVYNRKVFNQIMDQALVFLDSEKYLQAIKLYSTGFDLSKRTFEESDYDILIKDPVNRTMGRVENMIEELDAQWDEFLELTEAYTQDAQSQDGPIDIIAITESLNQLIDYREELYDSYLSVDRINSLVVASSQESQEDFYLSFMERLMTGRQAQIQREGIVASIDSYIDQNLSLLEIYYRENMQLRDSMAQTLYNQRNWDGAEEQYLEKITLAQEWEDLLSLSNLRIHEDEEGNFDSLSDILLATYYPKEGYTRYELREAQELANETRFRKNYEARESLYNQGNLEDYWLFREELISALPGLNEGLDSFQEFSQNQLENPQFNNPTWIEDRTEKLYTTLINDIRVLESDVIVFLSERDLAPYRTDNSELENLISSNQRLIEGQDNIVEGEIFRLRYPQRALDNLNLLNVQSRELEGNLTEYINLYSDEADSISYNGPVEERVDEARTLLSQIRNQISLLQELTRQGQDFVNLASENLNQGNTRYNRAENELVRFNFDQAETALGQAQVSYTTALSYNEDILLRDEVTERINNLQARIIDERNKQVVREVRALINQASSDYFQGLYLRSEASLSQAENRWYTTNNEANNEIQYWLNLVRAALSVESGRTLDTTNPLYQDITKLFNLAHQSYQSGKEALGRGDRVGAIGNLNQADRYLNQILIPLPTNQDARVLKLRIQQELDPQAFGETFQEMIRGARSKIQNGNDLDTAYLDLKDLFSIDPEYRGLASLILETEYLLGLKVRPPNPQDLRKSRENYNRALEIYEGGNQLLFASALELLDDAIALNPRNTDARTLKDQVAIYVINESSITLTPAEQLIYREAEDKYLSGDFFEALNLTNQLMENPRNRNYAPLQDLIRRIESNI